ncbi:AI-2E family transporter [Oharaeibacter diazotrophicus]|uniref:Putative PurR-regulated permease PerM n=1 Tax=Oharaeibacter diazotrophicus TaxID=1920512 RepID=A0A4V3CWR5_9HYPH|nr:AI-2E family transporter [Oharaeibacter diazotrophicus]TDP87408.1 putative PurR-regulated permease PerM [Oharaeibacter diazotrophicus]BBE70648.1 AI-2 transport protein TqsA [Pleomorphomonas sp. SM30]GLS77394.1 AI-2E family transporter [Oharaeibacter diazotrophicus]
MKLRSTILFWLGAAAVFVLLLYVFSGVLLPFVAGMALAYLLDPVADSLERAGLSRTIATVLILVAFLMMTVLLLIVLVPVLGTQLTGFLTDLPDYANRLQRFVNSTAGKRIFGALKLSPTDVKGSLGEIVNQGASWLGTIMASLWNGGQALMSIVSLLVVTPVVAFYMLLDWDHMVKKVDSWIPRDHQITVRRLAREMDQGVSNFVRGQVSVSALLGAFYAIGLTLCGLNFGLLIGLFAGLISFIPYVGSIVGGILAIGVAIVQFWPDWTWVAVVAGVFALGQFIEGNILQPKLIGNSVGLHPVWLMFALFAFGALFGFVGMLVAVPATTAIAVLIRFALAQYLASALYRGRTATLEVPTRRIDLLGEDHQRP